MVVVVSLVADGGWMVVVLAVGVGVVLAADDGQCSGVVSSWYRLMLVTVLKVMTLLAAVEVAAVVVVVVVVVAVAAMVSVLSKQPTGRSPFCCL